MTTKFFNFLAFYFYGVFYDSSMQIGGMQQNENLASSKISGRSWPLSQEDGGQWLAISWRTLRFIQLRLETTWWYLHLVENYTHKQSFCVSTFSCFLCSPVFIIIFRFGLHASLFISHLVTSCFILKDSCVSYHSFTCCCFIPLLQ